MVNIDDETGRSKYLVSEGERAAMQEHPLYVAVREYIQNNVPLGSTILDIGGGVPYGTGVLASQYEVVNLDLDFGTLLESRKLYPEISCIQGDATTVPFTENSTINHEIGAVVLLDIVEHFPIDVAQKLLRNINNIVPESACVIVSIPIIDWLSIPHLVEFMNKITMNLKGKEVATGLFDKTHMLALDMRQQMEIFNQCGWQIQRAETTNWIEGVSGIWDSDFVTHPYYIRGSKKYNLLSAITFNIIPFVLHPFDQSKRREVTDRLIGYQGFYVLKKKIIQPIS